MTFTELNASHYDYNRKFYNSEFEIILTKIILCYNLMLLDNVQLPNDENKIRDMLLINYLKNNTVRKKLSLTDFLFDREVPEDRTMGRTDIKIQTINTFEDTDAYYTIECKRLDDINTNGTTGLNAKYIGEGIFRFASSIYSSHYDINGMIGFVVHHIDIDKNIECINTLLLTSYKNIKTIKVIGKQSLYSGFEYSYCSTHLVNNNECKLYHLMLDFSKNIF